MKRTAIRVAMVVTLSLGLLRLPALATDLMIHNSAGLRSNGILIMALLGLSLLLYRDASAPIEEEYDRRPLLGSLCVLASGFILAQLIQRSFYLLGDLLQCFREPDAYTHFAINGIEIAPMDNLMINGADMAVIVFLAWGLYRVGRSCFDEDKAYWDTYRGAGVVVVLYGGVVSIEDFMFLHFSVFDSSLWMYVGRLAAIAIGVKMVLYAGEKDGRSFPGSVARISETLVVTGVVGMVGTVLDDLQLLFVYSGSGFFPPLWMYLMRFLNHGLIIFAGLQLKKAFGDSSPKPCRCDQCCESVGLPEGFVPLDALVVKAAIRSKSIDCHHCHAQLKRSPVTDRAFMALVILLFFQGFSLIAVPFVSLGKAAMYVLLIPFVMGIGHAEKLLYNRISLFTLQKPAAVTPEDSPYEDLDDTRDETYSSGSGFWQ